MDFDFAALSALNSEHQIARDEYIAVLLQGAETIARRESGKLPGQVLAALAETGNRQCILMVAERLRGGRSSYDRSMGWALSKVNDPAIGAEVAGYLLPLFDDATTALDSGWRQYYLDKPDLYRVKDNAAFAVNRLLGHPLPDFIDVTPPHRDAEIEKLRKICAERGIQPAFEVSKMP